MKGGDFKVTIRTVCLKHENAETKIKQIVSDMSKSDFK